MCATVFSKMAFALLYDSSACSGLLSKSAQTARFMWMAERSREWPSSHGSLRARAFAFSLNAVGKSSEHTETHTAKKEKMSQRVAVRSTGKKENGLLACGCRRTSLQEPLRQN